MIQGKICKMVQDPEPQIKQKTYKNIQEILCCVDSVAISFWFSCMGKKVPFWQFFRMGCDGRALLGWPLRIPHRNWKIIIVLGADEYIERLEGKIRKCFF